MRMRQEGDIYFIKEFVVDTKMKLSTKVEYQSGDNSDVFPTDTMKNRVYALATTNVVSCYKSCCACSLQLQF